MRKNVEIILRIITVTVIILMVYFFIKSFIGGYVLLYDDGNKERINNFILINNIIIKDKKHIDKIIVHSTMPDGNTYEIYYTDKNNDKKTEKIFIDSESTLSEYSIKHGENLPSKYGNYLKVCFYIFISIYIAIFIKIFVESWINRRE